MFSMYFVSIVTTYPPQFAREMAKILICQDAAALLRNKMLEEEPTYPLKNRSKPQKHWFIKRIESITLLKYFKTIGHRKYHTQVLINVFSGYACKNKVMKP